MGFSYTHLANNRGKQIKIQILTSGISEIIKKIDDYGNYVLNTTCNFLKNKKISEDLIQKLTDEIFLLRKSKNKTLNLSVSTIFTSQKNSKSIFLVF